MTQVKELIDRSGWKLNHIDTDSGFYDQRIRPARVTGSQSIAANLGDYQGIPWEANVTVYWGFDRQGKLIDSWVWKTWNTL